MIQNNLFLNRLLIYTDEGNVAYDQLFHKGINIIRGDNSSGKSTITHFIFFILGGSFTEFVPEAHLCSRVYAEVEINGTTYTLRRDLIKNDEGKINDKVKMYTFIGKLDESLSPPKEKTWNKFEYNLTSKKSFSIEMFESLNIPTVKGENNITMHQLLRLFYIDQESPTNSLFKFEQFDSQLTRKTVSELLLGVYNQELYEKRRRLVEADKELKEIKSEIKATKRFFKDPTTLQTSHLKTYISQKEEDISDIELEIIKVREAETPVSIEDGEIQFKALTDTLISQKKKVQLIVEKFKKAEYEVEDTSFFVQSLEKKIKALRSSVLTRNFLGKFPLEYCPECLTEIPEKEDSQQSCKLCKEPIDESYGITQARRIEQELSFQIIDAKAVIEKYKTELRELSGRRELELSKLAHIQIQVDNSVQSVTSTIQKVLESLYNTKGYLEGELTQYRTLLENAVIFEGLIKERDNLKNEVKSLDSYIRYAENEQDSKRVAITKKIKEEGLSILNKDFDRQEDFKSTKEFYIDFANNMTYLSNKHAKYSASSNFLLKVSARFAVFFASLSVDSMRFPRFIFSDNMEDKGIEHKRAQNLQRVLVKRAEEFDASTFQMIYTTSTEYIPQELNNSAYCVGEHYTKKSPTLKNIVYPQF